MKKMATKKQQVFKVLDAGWGKQGFFSLVKDGDDLFIHYNKQPDGYAVFQIKNMDEQQAQKINRGLVSLLREFEEGHGLNKAVSDKLSKSRLRPST